MALQAVAQVAVDAVVKASRVCEAVRTGGLLQAIDKADKSPVTVADYAAQVRLTYDIETEREGGREEGGVETDLRSLFSSLSFFTLVPFPNRSMSDIRPLSSQSWTSTSTIPSLARRCV
jgi:hypothetical protein